MPKDDINGTILILIDPLVTLILTGSNKVSQIGAAVCLSDFVSHMDYENINHKRLLEGVDVKIINMIAVL
jgi:hypothetical protein